MFRADGGELIERRIRTEAERFAAVFGDVNARRPRYGPRPRLKGYFFSASGSR